MHPCLGCSRSWHSRACSGQGPEPGLPFLYPIPPPHLPPPRLHRRQSSWSRRPSLPIACREAIANTGTPPGSQDRTRSSSHKHRYCNLNELCKANRLGVRVRVGGNLLVATRYVSLNGREVRPAATSTATPIRKNTQGHSGVSHPHSSWCRRLYVWPRGVGRSSRSRHSTPRRQMQG
jgi:hypothetical protein